MTDILRIKRRGTGGTGAPASLANAELAFNEMDNTLYYGKGDSAGAATSIIAIASQLPVSIPNGGTAATTRNVALDNLSGVSGSTAGAMVRAAGGTWGVATGGAGLPAAGSNTQVQFNANGPFGASSALTWNAPTLTVGVVGGQRGQLVLASTTNASVTLQSATGSSGNVTFSLPLAHGSAGAPLVNDGAGNLTFISPLPIANGGTGASTAATAPWVEVAGDTMTGNLTIAQASGNAEIYLHKSGSGTHSLIYGRRGTSNRWLLSLGDDVAESGSNTGSDFRLYRGNDAGTLIDSPLVISRATGTVTMSGNLLLSTGATAPQINLKNTSTGTTATDGFEISVDNTNRTAYLWNYENAAMSFGTANGERLVLQADGNLKLTGYYFYLANSTGAANASGGTFLYADPVNMVAHTGTNGWFYVQKGDGTNIGGFKADGWAMSLGTRNTIMNDGGSCVVANGDGVGCLYLQGSTGWNVYRNANRHSFEDMSATPWFIITSGATQSRGVVYASTGIDGNTWFGTDGSYSHLLWNSGCFIQYRRFDGGLSFYVNNARMNFQAYAGGIFQADNGPVAGLGAYINNSDARMKEDIVDLDHGLDTLMKLKPVEYTRLPIKYGEGPTPEPPPRPRRRELGFLAQDLLDELPEAVVELPHGIGGVDRFEGSSQPPLGIQSEMILAVVVKALQQLNAEITLLKQRLDDLAESTGGKP